MTADDISFVPSDNRVTRQERRRQSAYREEVLGLPPGRHPSRGLFGNYLRPEDWHRNFLSDEAADYAYHRVPEVRATGGQLEESRLRTNMLSSMPLAFSVFGHLRAHPEDALVLFGRLLGLRAVELLTVSVGDRPIGGIECEWAPDPRDHLRDGSAFDAVVALRTADGRSHLVAVETKYVDSFSRDRTTAEKDAKYDDFCRTFGMAEGAFGRLGRDDTRQLLRNVLLTESVRHGGVTASLTFDSATTLVFARHDDRVARDAVAEVDRFRGSMATDVRFLSHRELADAADAVPGLADWSARLRRRYVGS